MNEKCLEFLSMLEKIFQRDLKLSRNVQDYIDAALLNPTPSELERQIRKGFDCENEALLELIFFPDESMQCELESFLEVASFNKEDEANIIRRVSDQKFMPMFHFPDNRGKASVPMTAPASRSFINRLYVYRKLDSRLLQAIDIYLPKKTQTRIKVKLRNSRVVWTENRVEFFCSFFQKFTREDPYPVICFMLEFFCEHSDNKNILESLCAKKKSLFLNLQTASKAESLMKKSNMESVILSGIKIPYVDKKEIMEKMIIIDRVTLDVFGVIENFEPIACCSEVVDSVDDVDRIVKLLI
jgi:hypothetical protein